MATELSEERSGFLTNNHAFFHWSTPNMKQNTAPNLR